MQRYLHGTLIIEVKQGWGNIRYGACEFSFIHERNNHAYKFETKFMVEDLAIIGWRFTVFTHNPQNYRTYFMGYRLFDDPIEKIIGDVKSIEGFQEYAVVEVK